MSFSLWGYLLLNCRTWLDLNKNLVDLLDGRHSRFIQHKLTRGSLPIILGFPSFWCHEKDENSFCLLQGFVRKDVLMLSRTGKKTCPWEVVTTRPWGTFMTLWWCKIFQDVDFFNPFFSFRYNSHTIKFTLLMCTIQWFFIYSQNCATIVII